jgi:hypothetical protein
MWIVGRSITLASHNRDNARLSGDFRGLAGELRRELIGKQAGRVVGVDGPSLFFGPIGEAVVLQHCDYVRIGLVREREDALFEAAILAHLKAFGATCEDGFVGRSRTPFV